MKFTKNALIFGTGILVGGKLVHWLLGFGLTGIYKKPRETDKEIFVELNGKKYRTVVVDGAKHNSVYLAVLSDLN